VVITLVEVEEVPISVSAVLVAPEVLVVEVMVVEVLMLAAELLILVLVVEEEQVVLWLEMFTAGGMAVLV
jgi:hypothetical protein